MISEPIDFETAWEALTTGDFVYDSSQPLRKIVRQNVLTQDRGVYVIRNANHDVL